MKMKMSTLAAMAGIGTLSWMIAKKMNPDMVEDMKKMMKKSANKMIENMD